MQRGLCADHCHFTHFWVFGRIVIWASKVDYKPEETSSDVATRDQDLLLK